MCWSLPLDCKLHEVKKQAFLTLFPSLVSSGMSFLDFQVLGASWGS